MRQWIVLSGLILFLANSAWAIPMDEHYFWMKISGDQNLAAGDTTAVDVYIRAIEDFERYDMRYWSFSLGFDPEALQWDGWEFGSIDAESPWEHRPFYGPPTLVEGGSAMYAGADLIQNAEGQVGSDLNAHYYAEPGEDIHLATFTFTYLGGTADGRDDIWLEFGEDEGSYWWQDTWGIPPYIYKQADPDRGGADLSGGLTPEPGATVPEPGTLWLLGVGIAGFFGVLRRNRG